MTTKFDLGDEVLVKAKILDASIFESGVKYAVEVAGEIKHYKEEDLIPIIPYGETKKRAAKNHTLWALKVAMQLCRGKADEMEKQKSYLTAGIYRGYEDELMELMNSLKKEDIE